MLLHSTILSIINYKLDWPLASVDRRRLLPNVLAGILLLGSVWDCDAE